MPTIRMGGFEREPQTVDLMISRHLPTSPAVLRQKLVETLKEKYGEPPVGRLMPVLNDMGVTEMLILFAELEEKTY